jgi:ABC-type Mn2+/Zn2+ transport system ATPase subunit
MQPAEVLVKATEVSLGYAQRTVLHGVNLEVRSGEFWFCLGLNGAGKTTLLQALLGAQCPQTGQLWLHPQLVGRQRVGFVPQRCALNPTLSTTVREFVLLGTVGTRQRRQERRAHLQWALTQVGLEGLERRDYWSLSGGQQQRALVARALIRRPRLLLLDEPTSGLDPPATEALLQCLAVLHRQEGVTLCCVTHDLTLAVRYATHLVLLASGTAVAGPAHEVLTRHRLASVYGANIAVTQDATGVATVRVARLGGAL